MSMKKRKNEDRLHVGVGVNKKERPTIDDVVEDEDVEDEVEDEDVEDEDENLNSIAVSASASAGYYRRYIAGAIAGSIALAVATTAKPKKKSKWETVRNFLNIVRAVTAFNGQSTVGYLQYIKGIIPKIAPTIINESDQYYPFIHSTIDPRWRQSTAVESFAGGRSYFIHRRNGTIWIPNQGYGRVGDADYIPPGDTPYRFKRPIRINGVAFYAIFVIIGHGELWPVEDIACLTNDCSETVEVTVDPIASLGNANWATPSKDINEVKAISKGEKDSSSGRITYKTGEIYKTKKGDADSRINPNRRHTVRSNKFVLNKRYIFDEPIIADDVERTTADNDNYGVYIGDNNLGIPPGVKLNIRRQLNDKKEITLIKICRYIIRIFGFKKGDKFTIVDATCQIVARISEDKRNNRATVRYYESLVDGINNGLSFNKLQEIVASRYAARKQLYKSKGNQPNSPRTSQAIFAEELEENIANSNVVEVEDEDDDDTLKRDDVYTWEDGTPYYGEAVEAGGALLKKKVITRKLKPSLLKNARIMKPTRNLKQNTNKSRKKHVQLNISRKQFRL